MVFQGTQQLAEGLAMLKITKANSEKVSEVGRLSQINSMECGKTPNRPCNRERPHKGKPGEIQERQCSGGQQRIHVNLSALVTVF